jgi:hypothetical protein
VQHCSDFDAPLLQGLQGKVVKSVYTRYFWNRSGDYVCVCVSSRACYVLGKLPGVCFMSCVKRKECVNMYDLLTMLSFTTCLSAWHAFQQRIGESVVLAVCSFLGYVCCGIRLDQYIDMLSTE